MTTTTTKNNKTTRKSKKSNNKSEMVELCERKCINRIIKLLLVQNRILVPSIMNFFLSVQNRKSEESSIA